MRVAKAKTTQNRLFTPIEVKEPKILALLLASETDALPRYALRSKKN